MKALVTGCAGFIGSTLVDRLLAEGYEVVGIDRFSDYYPREIKERNLAHAIGHPSFTFIEEDILLMEGFPGVDFVFHLAAQAGVRAVVGEEVSRSTPATTSRRPSTCSSIIRTLIPGSSFTPLLPRFTEIQNSPCGKTACHGRSLPTG